MMPAIRKALGPVLDRRGKFAPFKTLVFVLLFYPFISVTLGYTQDTLGPRPNTEAIHQIGLWTLRLIFLSLAVTPLQTLLKWPRLIDVRRMLGVAAFVYVLLHLLIYTADQKFILATVASEIVLRIYLTIGFIAIIGLGALAATSTDNMIRALGRPRWLRLHRLLYVIGVLTLIHFFMQSKANVYEPTIMAGLYVWLIGWRLLAAYGRNWIARAPVLCATGLSVVAALLTLLGEPLYFKLVSNIDPWRILKANLYFDYEIRPTWIVLGIGLAVTLVSAVRLGAQRFLTRPARIA